jgi:hypothetical protein
MPLNITRGRLKSASRVIIYGPEGIGKTTLAAAFPTPIIIDAEDGSGQLDVARVTALDWFAIEAATKELVKDRQGFSTVVFDSIDWIEAELTESMLKKDRKDSIEDYGWGGGYKKLQEKLRLWLDDVDKLIAAGVHVVFVAHSKVVRVSPPDQTDGFDRWELKLSKHVAPLVKEWADMILFCNFDLQIVEGNDKKIKAVGGRERIMHAEHSAAWDAKNRHGLPSTMPMVFDSIAKAIEQAPQERSTGKQATLPEAKKPAAPAEQPPTQEDPICCSNEQVARIIALATTPELKEIAKAHRDREGAIEFAELSPEAAAICIKELESAGQEKSKYPANVMAWLIENEAKLTPYFVQVGWLTVGQTWRDLGDEEVEKIINRTDRLAKAAGIPALTKEAAA